MELLTKNYMLYNVFNFVMESYYELSKELKMIFLRIIMRFSREREVITNKLNLETDRMQITRIVVHIVIVQPILLQI